MTFIKIVPVNSPYPLDEETATQLELTGANPTFDAFNRLRVSQPETLFDSALQYDLQPNVWETVTSTGGTAVHVANQSSCAMTVDATADARVVRQSRRYMRYNPGKSHLWLATGVLGDATEGVTQRVGLFDDQNGVFFQQTAAGLSVVRRSYTSGSVEDEVVAQADWNRDRMDGTGLSGITLDATKAQIFLADMEWLGVGRVRMCFVVGGVIHIAHEFNHANKLETAYMTTATLPVRYEIVNGASGSAGATMYQNCSTVVTEGGDAFASGSSFAVSNGTSTIGVTTRRAILSIRPKATFGGVTNRALIVPAGMSLHVEAGKNAYWELVRGGTLGGTPSWTSADDNSAVEYDVAGTTVTGGRVIAAGYDSPGDASLVDLARLANTDIPLTLDAAGNNPTVLSLVVTSMSATTNVGGSLTWLEAK